MRLVKEEVKNSWCSSSKLSERNTRLQTASEFRERTDDHHIARAEPENTWPSSQKVAV